MSGPGPGMPGMPAAARAGLTGTIVKSDISSAHRGVDSISFSIAVDGGTAETTTTVLFRTLMIFSSRWSLLAVNAAFSRRSSKCNTSTLWLAGARWMRAVCSANHVLALAGASLRSTTQ